MEEAPPAPIQEEGRAAFKRLSLPLWLCGSRLTSGARGAASFSTVSRPQPRAEVPASNEVPGQLADRLLNSEALGCIQFHNPLIKCLRVNYAFEFPQSAEQKGYELSHLKPATPLLNHPFLG